jgi:hypothetical protein
MIQVMLAEKERRTVTPYELQGRKFCSFTHTCG